MAEQINHPILITECACNPVQSRSKMAELLFETYGVPSIGSFVFTYNLQIYNMYLFDFVIFIQYLAVIFFTAFGVDAAFSYKYNQQLGICDEDGLTICSGFTTSHVIPVCNLSWRFIYVIMIITTKCIAYYQHKIYLLLLMERFFCSMWVPVYQWRACLWSMLSY